MAFELESQMCSVVAAVVAADPHSVHPGSTTLPNFEISFASSLNTPRITLCAFLVTFCFLVCLKSANPSVFTLASISLLSVIIQAAVLSYMGTELIC